MDQKDTLTEREMQANLREICERRTTLIIAHRLSTVMMADRIFVLGKEKEYDLDTTIVEAGTHQELLEKNGIYTKMWRAQSASEVDTPVPTH